MKTQKEFVNKKSLSIICILTLATIACAPKNKSSNRVAKITTGTTTTSTSAAAKPAGAPASSTPAGRTAPLSSQSGSPAGQTGGSTTPAGQQGASLAAGQQGGQSQVAKTTEKCRITNDLSAITDPDEKAEVEKQSICESFEFMTTVDGDIDFSIQKRDLENLTAFQLTDYPTNLAFSPPSATEKRKRTLVMVSEKKSTEKDRIYLAYQLADKIVTKDDIAKADIKIIIKNTSGVSFVIVSQNDFNILNKENDELSYIQFKPEAIDRLLTNINYTLTIEYNF